ncbi:TetR/AcrR family transcriptional regulator [Microvirga calopogonii]|uniref:TetR/AcrR family transcriptional regulator n=1 Tax=Microvirga calopogonii TaxID=2078013 RepID=UPI000E0D499F|nr:TetR/AcrR family transcriptional regulator [Microvirga calopogonii]
MRVSREQADKNREHVIDVASRLFRERGFEGIGVSDLMKEAGLTHGGFYGQFDSKEDLKVQASRRALSGNKDRWAQVLAETPSEKLAALARFYLSEAHRDRRGEGCALAALGAEAPRSSVELQAAFRDGLEGYLELLDGIVPESASEEDRRSKSISALSTMVGALVLSRAVGDEALSRTILSAAANEIAARSE